MKVKEIIRLIEKDGWRIDRQKGSHIIYIHPSKKGIVVVPNQGMSSDLKIGTENSIMKQAGLK
jgi:predicted RNA binding protein YcfA (HicA-like mRNA interferase family)